MHFISVACTSLVALGLVHGRAVRAPIGYVVHEKRDRPHPALKRRVPLDAVIPIRISLTQNVKALEDAEKVG